MGPNKGVRMETSELNPNDISVFTQTAGFRVVISEVAFEQAGWVVIHEDQAGSPGNILGAQRFDAGAYSGGAVDLLRGSISGGTYYAMLHQDDGDKVFNHKLDLPILDENERIVMVSFVAL